MLTMFIVSVPIFHGIFFDFLQDRFPILNVDFPQMQCIITAYWNDSSLQKKNTWKVNLSHPGNKIKLKIST